MDIIDRARGIRPADFLIALENTGIEIFLYYPQQRKVAIPEKLSQPLKNAAVYDNAPDIIVKHVFTDDREDVKNAYEKIHNGEKTVTIKVRNVDQSRFIKVTMTTVVWDENGKPEIAFGVVEDATDSYRRNQLTESLQERLSADGSDSEMNEIMRYIATSIGSQYYAIYHIWVKSHRYVCFHRKNDGVLSLIGENGIYEPAWDRYLDKYVEEEDREAMKNFADLSTLPERLRDCSSVSHNYRRVGIGWTRGTFFAGHRDENGTVTNVVYAVSDINEEVRLEENQQSALFEAEHDPLTGVYNRNGIDRILASETMQNGRMGFAVLDIDNFKSINDHYGHDMGDKVLVAVAEQLSLVFRQEDIVARIGGDEFAVVFMNCDESAWKSICLKFRMLHVALESCFSDPAEMSVTVSVGLSFSDSGYSHELYVLADEGLYETKKKGRAGCTHVGADHQILNHWQDEDLSLLAKNVLEYNNTGICQIEFPFDKSKPRRLLCGDTARLLLGISKNASPEECYAIWRDRIEPEYRDTIHRAELTAFEYGQTECTFLWNHPDHGKIFLRCGGVGQHYDDKLTLTGYCHTLRNTRIVERKTDKETVLQAMNDTFVLSYYLNLKDKTAELFSVASPEDYSFSDAQTLPEILSSLISNAVDPRDEEVMKDFLDMDTLQERLGNSHFIDAEYRSLKRGCWCRAKLVPVKHDEEGKLTHALLAVSTLDSGKFKEFYTLDYNRKSLSALFDNLPCGVIMYEWNGKTLEAVHVSKYYAENSGHMFTKNDDDNNYRMNFNSIHPDDRVECHKAIMKALRESEPIHYVYRVWDRKINNYIWERFDAAVSAQPDGTQYIYAVYTDVTVQKEQELRLQKSHASLLAALDASSQLCYEYDPLLHTGECLTEENFLGLPSLIENCPVVLKEADVFYPGDADVFIATAHQIDNGAEQSQCDVRIKSNGVYGWYACTFNAYFDPEKERKVAILTLMDITLRMSILKSYEDRINSISAVTENTLCMSMLNLTENTYEVLECKNILKPILDDSLPLEEFLANAGKGIIGAESRNNYLKTFNREYLLQQAADGNMHVEAKYILNMGEQHYEWVFSAIDLVKNPLTEEITGVGYSRSVQTDKMNELILERALERDYMFASIIFVDTDEFYLYNPSKGRYSESMQGYWEVALSGSKQHCSEEIYNELQKTITKENILAYLEQHSEYIYAYNGVVNGKAHRLEIGFCYADREHTMFLATMRNITDDELLEKYRYDSEHDSLTGLYNRKAMFTRCRELLNEHPEDTFAMVHADLKHFRLYNTFFGDDVGDKLLCDMADQISWMDEDYEYWAYGRIEADVFAVFFPFKKDLYDKHLEKLLNIMKDYRSDFLIEPKLGLYFVEDREMQIEAMFNRATLASKTVTADTPLATAVFNDEMEKTLVENQQILNEMQTAVEQEQFAVYLQPKYSLRTGKAVGAEALVRWIHPVKGVVSPGRFIPIFEGNGYISVLDRYMWEHTCIILRRWKDSGKAMMPVSVNVSRISMYKLDTVSYLKELVEKYGIEPKYLQLELTESVYVESMDEIRPRLSELQEYGFTILMDDFGSGYSSLNTLKSLPVDILKLDMKFLSPEGSDRGSKVLASIIRMSKLLNLPVVAEGVENEKQAEYLHHIGCEYVQGFLFARPMPVSEYESTILDSETDVCQEETEENECFPITELLNCDSVTAQMIDTKVLTPMVLIEYHDRQICCLRANNAFLDVFEMEEDLRPASLIIKERLSEQDYDRMLRAFEKCSETKKDVSFRISWRTNESEQRKYLVNAVFEGNIGVDNNFAVAFVDENPKNYIE